MSSRYRAPAVLLLLMLPCAMAHGGDGLFYLEAQAVAGWSSALDRSIFYSMDQDTEMQKPSIGFDYLKRFSNESGDRAVFAAQFRLALTREDDTWEAEPQVYNLYLKARTPPGYVWIGHNRPAFGLSSYLDSHGLLLPTLAMQGFGYDRDWGLGLTRDFARGDIALSVTSGSGMPVYGRGNHLAALRASYGVLNRENFNVGVSLAHGTTMNTMGYHLMDPDPRRASLAGIDATVLLNNMEHRLDMLSGRWLDRNTHAVSYRFGVNLDPEGRRKIETQPTYWASGDDENAQASLCFSTRVTGDVTVRLGYTYNRNPEENRILLQIYYYGAP